MKNNQAGLLSDNDPPPFYLHNGNGVVGFLFTGDHTGNTIPIKLKQMGLREEELSRHITFDIGTREVILRMAESFDAPAIMGNYSRLVVDLNRRLDDPSAFPELVDNIPIPENQQLGDLKRQERIDSVYNPYHNAIDTQLKKFAHNNVVPALISIHSFTPVLMGEVRECHMGVLWDKDDRIALPLIQRLRENADIVVGDNEPYSGRHMANFTIDHHAEPAGLPYVGIEIRQDLLRSTERIRRWSDILKDALDPILADTRLYTQQLLARTTGSEHV